MGCQSSSLNRAPSSTSLTHLSFIRRRAASLSVDVSTLTWCCLTWMSVTWTSDRFRRLYHFFDSLFRLRNALSSHLTIMFRRRVSTVNPRSTDLSRVAILAVFEVGWLAEDEGWIEFERRHMFVVRIRPSMPWILLSLLSRNRPARECLPEQPCLPITSWHPWAAP